MRDTRFSILRASIGVGHNETLIGEVLRSRRDEYILASKCGIINRDGKRGVDGTPENIKTNAR